MNMHSRLARYSCPCCGHDIGSAANIQIAAQTIKNPMRKLMVRALMRNIGEPIGRDAFVDLIYSGTDGGPENAWTVIRQQIHFLRQELEQYGWTISNNNGGRGRVAAYRLIPLEAGP